MRIAFYAPLKPPDHPTPSGDRLMANLLMAALRAAGHEVLLASRLRTFSHDPAAAVRTALSAASADEAHSLVERWSGAGRAARPHCWFTYHLFYKSPDWLGPAVCRELGVPYVTAEASYAGKRDAGPWRPWQDQVVAAVRQARVNFCFTARDREGLEAMSGPLGALLDLPPFLDAPPAPAAPRPAAERGERATRLVTVAMMRPGNKLASYRALAEALRLVRDVPWQLSIAGDGPASADVRAAFAAFPAERVQWLGRLAGSDIAAHLAAGDVFVWPGVREPFGLVFLEAQAMGLPAVAFDDGGVSAVVRSGETGLLVPAGNLAALAGAIRRLLVDGGLRLRMAAAAERFVREERTVAAAAAILRQGLRPIEEMSPGARP